jgi:hypothetical protein
MIIDINSQDRLVQKTFAAHLAKFFDTESLDTYSASTARSEGTLGRTFAREMAMPAAQQVNSHCFKSGQVIVK